MGTNLSGSQVFLGLGRERMVGCHQLRNVSPNRKQKHFFTTRMGVHEVCGQGRHQTPRSKEPALAIERNPKV